MYKMIIVDDEDFSRQGIRECINWNVMDIDIVGECSNGLDAILLIHNVSPDIIICDIRMPKLDGISLINKVHQSHPNLQVIFLSGYSDKEYLKNAIKLEAVDYIFKPFQLHELVCAVEKAKKNCQQRKVVNSQLNSDIALELIKYNKDEPCNINLDDLPISLDKSFITIIIKINSFNIQQTKNKLDNAFDARVTAFHFYNAFKEVANNIFSKRYIMSCVDFGYIIHANVDNDFLHSQTVFNELRRFFFTIEGSKDAIAVGLSNPANSISDIKNNYFQAKDAISASFLVGYGNIILYSDLSKTQFKEWTLIQQEFYDKILNNNFVGAISFLNKYIEYMRNCRIKDIPFIKDVLASIAFWINERLANFSNESNGYVTDMINYAADINVIREYILNQIDTYVSDVANLDNKGRILMDVEKFITTNYNKELSIKTIAQKVFISPNYLCYLYKKNTGRTLNQFILDVKMEKAKELICTTNMKLGDVSEALGYASQNYFTRIFTKYFGFSPRTYRNKYGKVGLIDLECEENSI